jgi:ABC-type Co2+ transport system permease subunit
MPTLYMTLWSAFMIIALGLGRLRNWRQMVLLALVTAFVLILSQSLYIQLSISAGLDPSGVMYGSADFLRRGPLGWLALLVMPCGWLGPMVGLNLIHRWTRSVNRTA